MKLVRTKPGIFSPGSSSHYIELQNAQIAMNAHNAQECILLGVHLKIHYSKTSIWDPDIPDGTDDMGGTGGMNDMDMNFSAVQCSVCYLSGSCIHDSFNTCDMVSKFTLSK